MSIHAPREGAEALPLLIIYLLLLQVFSQESGIRVEADTGVLTDVMSCWVLCRRFGV